MVGARRSVTSRVGVAVADGREMRAGNDDHWLTGQPRAIVKKKTYLTIPEAISNLFASTVPYGTVLDRNHR